MGHYLRDRKLSMNASYADFICHSTDLMNSHRCVVGVLTPSVDLSTLLAPMQQEKGILAPDTAIRDAAALIRSARYLTAFTGAGVSVESGIPPFRGEGGLWSRYDPRMLELDYFLAHPETAWPVIREIFYDHFGAAKPNRAHEVLAAWEARGLLKVLITQNIDSVQLN